MAKEPIMYDDALAVQSACNLSGVVQSFATHIRKIVKEGKGTDYVNNHPVSRLFAEQISHLTRNKDYSDAYKECKAKAITPDLWVE